eukprot:365063-Chlamydomonas_euryale.AAC.1
MTRKSRLGRDPLVKSPDLTAIPVILTPYVNRLLRGNIPPVCRVRGMGAVSAGELRGSVFLTFTDRDDYLYPP